jgi:predicted ester cyclase
MISEGNRIAVRYSWKGTYKGIFQGIPSTGKQVILSIFETDRISNGKFVEHRMGVDFSSLMTQLGVIPVKK